MKPIILDNSKENAVKAVKALIKQRVASRDDEVGCKYFLKGNRCIVGHMMSEEDAIKLEKSIEEETPVDTAITTLIRAGLVELLDPEGLKGSDLRALQYTHDRLPPSEWEENFRVVLLKLVNYKKIMRSNHETNYFR